MKINYLYRRGRIVTTKYGYIYKILARPGQIVFDPITRTIFTLGQGEYILRDFRINRAHYLVAQEHTQPIAGNIYYETDIFISTVYEKKLRSKGILQSPDYNSIQPQGSKDELIVRRLSFSIRPKVLTIVSTDYSDNSPVFELSNGAYIPNAILKHLYRKPTDYEINYCKKNTHSTQLHMVS
jgi:hypothetical protein